jgi:hypothetical protein
MLQSSRNEMVQGPDELPLVPTQRHQSAAHQRRLGQREWLLPIAREIHGEPITLIELGAFGRPVTEERHLDATVDYTDGIRPGFPRDAGPQHGVTINSVLPRRLEGLGVDPSDAERNLSNVGTGRAVQRVEENALLYRRQRERRLGPLSGT